MKNYASSITNYYLVDQEGRKQLRFGSNGQFQDNLLLYLVWVNCRVSTDQEVGSTHSALQSRLLLYASLLPKELFALLLIRDCRPSTVVEEPGGVIETVPNNPRQEASTAKTLQKEMEASFANQSQPAKKTRSKAKAKDKEE